jgi:hypothetical protein
MKLTTEQLKQAYVEVTQNHREPVGAIQRLKGDREDYQKLYAALKWGAKL